MRREVEDELVAVVQKAIAVDRLVMADRKIAIQAGSCTRRVPIDRNRLNPMNDVLELEVRSYSLCYVQRRPGVGWLGANVQEHRAVPA
jgi:hypothetical protein